MKKAYLLHSRPYRETSALIDLFTEDSRWVRLVVKGINRNGKSAQQMRGVLQPFSPLLCEWRGRSELKSLRSVESSGLAFAFKDKVLYSAIYINELLTKLLPKIEPDELLFQKYEMTLLALSKRTTTANDQTDKEADLRAIAIALRDFEFHMLDSLGYGIDFENEAGSGEKILGGSHYTFERDRGFVKLSNSVATEDAQRLEPASRTRPSKRLFSGQDIHSIAERNWDSARALSSAKLLSRQAFDQLLGGVELDSRKLFR